MEKNKNKKLNNTKQFATFFKTPFLNTFFINLSKLNFSDKDLKKIDEILKDYSRQEIDWQLEDDLQDNNQMLASFAVSKAENSSLTLKEAEDIYKAIKSGNLGDDFLFLKDKLKHKEKLTQVDHDKLEYKNIASGFRYFADKKIKIKDLSLDLILDIHHRLTLGLDIFSDYLEGFEIYRSGKLRNDDKTRVGRYQPVNHKQIKESVSELITWLQKNPSLTNIFIFHIALYAIHPFKNGNKRVCRLLEHYLLQDLGYNQKDLYSLSYYYHKEKDRYYKYLFESLIKRDFSYFVSLASEALYFSVCAVIASVLSRKKEDVIKNSGLEKDTISIIRPLIKRRQANFTKLLALNKRKVSRQTLANHLNLAVDKGVLAKNKLGRNVFYFISGDYEEERILRESLRLAQEKNLFIPNNLVSYL
jgi:Fic family protein